MISTILPVWDGNQTWLVFGGAALYGAFPLAFSTILPLMYIPLLMMVIALLFRGIAFEFRLKSLKTKRLWEYCFFIGSLTATIAQGILLGTFIQGYHIGSDVSHQISEWLNPFSLACAAGLICGYVLLGTNYLIIKTTGDLQKKCYRISTIMQFVIVAGFIMVSIWSPYLDPEIMQRWFNPRYMPYLAILPISTMILFSLHMYGLKYKIERLPFWSLIGMFLACYGGFIISVFPYVVPRKITYIQAAAGDSALLFMLIGAVIMLPPLLFYTYHAYRIFQGKVTTKIGY